MSTELMRENAALIVVVFSFGIFWTYRFAYWRGFCEGLRWTHANMERRLGAATLRRFYEMAKQELKEHTDGHT